MISAPAWFHYLSIASLSLAGLCFLIIAIDLLKHPQHMWIMNIVWPVTAWCGLCGNISDTVGWLRTVWSTRRGNVGKSRRTSGSHHSP